MKRSNFFAHVHASAAVRLIVAVALVAGTLVIAGSPSGAAASWSVVPSASPAGPPTGSLAGVSCSSTTDCFAVGDTGSGTLIEHWDGASWKIVAGANAKGSIEPTLSAVSCTSATSCFAVGSTAVVTATSFSDSTLVERWDGKSWSVVPSPNPSNANEVALSGVSCTSATNCFAVGVAATFTPILSAPIAASTLIEHWDGASWSIVAAASPSSTIAAELTAVACPSATSCFAVGDYEAHATGGALMEHWDGASWSIVPSPDSAGASKSAFELHAFSRRAVAPRLAKSVSLLGDLQNGGNFPGLLAISCSSVTSCFAVGVSFTGALAERWDGVSWTIVDLPNPRGADGAELDGVSCTSPTDCAAVGSASIASGSGLIIEDDSSPLGEHWNGTSWTIDTGLSASSIPFLIGVVCPASTRCFAVGESALVEGWNGVSWSFAPFGSKSSESELNDVSCATTTNCFAVGSYETGSAVNPLVEHWNGVTWSLSASPTPKGARDAELESVSCSGPSDCSAVGYVDTSSAEKALIEHWNGTAWSIVASPTPKGAELTQLSGVSCPDATDCYAVGSALSFPNPTALTEHWNGKTWSVVPGAQAGSGTTFLELIGITCASALDCTAVGSSEAITLSGTGTPSAKTLVEHWNGTKWSVVASASPKGAPFALLAGVSCSSATSCLAVGFDAASVDAPEHALVEHWDGTSWKVVPSPGPSGAIETALVGASCRSDTSCDAVGFSGRTLAEHWNGSKMSIVPSANAAGASASGLSGVSCPGASLCVAVGSYGAHDGTFTLAERSS